MTAAQQLNSQPSLCRTAANSHNSSSACGSSDEDFEGDMRSRRNGARGAGQHVHSWEVGDGALQETNTCDMMRGPLVLQGSM